MKEYCAWTDYEPKKHKNFTSESTDWLVPLKESTTEGNKISRISNSYNYLEILFQWSVILNKSNVRKVLNENESRKRSGILRNLKNIAAEALISM